MNMPKQNGLETIPLLKEVSPESKILILSSFSESEKVYKSIKAGALGYMVKGGSRDQLVQAIRDVAAGQASLHPSIAMMVINEIEKPATMMYTTDPLTPRELDTLKLIARGHSNQEIAEILVVHERTVAKYVSSILAKLQLANRTQAALYALREGIAEPKTGKPPKLGKK
jgi:NarL family two-component system response regulator LiaR